jgi:cytochrome P450
MSAPVADVDFQSPELIADPYPTYAALRGEGPLLRNQDGQYLVTSYDIAREVLNRPDEFSSQYANKRMWGTPEYWAAQEVLKDTYPVVPALLTSDPPLHGRHRGLVRQAFSPRRVRVLEEFIASNSSNLAKTLPRGEVFDLFALFSAVLPLRLIIDAVGADQDDLHKIADWSDAYVAHVGRAVGPEEALRLAHLRVEFQNYLAERLDASEALPTDDIIGDLVRAERDEHAPLSKVEMIEILEQLLTGGNETAARLITFVMYRLAGDRELEARVRGDRQLVAALIEEMLRLETPVQSKLRTTTREAVLGGEELPSGVNVMVLFGCANRDEAQFPLPDEIVLDRKNGRAHLAFGFGPHYCIGAELARAEARIAVNTLLDTFAHIALSPDHGPPTVEPSFVHRGLSALYLQAS